MSGLRTGHLYPQGNIPGTHFCYRWSQPQGHSAAGRIMSTKNSKDAIWNRTLPACSAVTQPTAPPRAAGQKRDPYAVARLGYFEGKYPNSKTAHFAKQYCGIIFYLFFSTVCSFTCLSFASGLAMTIVIHSTFCLFILQCCPSYISRVASNRNDAVAANK